MNIRGRGSWQRLSRSPTIRLLLGLLLTLLAVAEFSAYSLHELSKLRQLQNQTIDTNRHDSLVLLRIQNDVNGVGLKLQDIGEHNDSDVLGYEDEFAVTRQDLANAIRLDQQFAPGTGNSTSRLDLQNAISRLWNMTDQMFALARAGKNPAARRLASGLISDQQIALERSISELLAANNEAEERADSKVASIYNGAERDIFVFVALAMGAIVITSGYLIYSNRRIFDRMEVLARQRRVLAARLISVQEEVLRSVSRELHDEFGQILTAVGAMLSRAERKGGLPPDSPFRTELTEVRQITQQTLEKMRSLSQMLHPAILDDYGLAKGVEWYAEVFQRQTGVTTNVTVTGRVVEVTGAVATHCFRILQEALTNVAKHSGSDSADVELAFGDRDLTLTVSDHGLGLPLGRKKQRPGLGMIAMHERAELVHGKLIAKSRPGGGTVVSLVMPLNQDIASMDDDVAGAQINEVLFRES